MAVQTSSSVAVPSRIVEDQAWSWHINNNCLYDSTTDRVYLGTVDMTDGKQYIYIFNNAGVYQSRVELSTETTYDVDDHNAAAMVIFGGLLYVLYTGHNDSGTMRWRVSTDTTPENLGAESTLSLDLGATYSQLQVLNGELYFTSRAGNDSWELYQLDGSSWTRLNDASTSASQTYLNMRSDGSTQLRYVAWDHPTVTGGSADPGPIRLREFTPNDAAASLSSLPALVTPAAGFSTRVTSVNLDATVIAYSLFELADLTNQTYYIARYSGSGDWDDSANWAFTNVGSTAYSFYPSSNYIGGVHIADVDGDKIWVCEAVAGTGYTTVKLGTWNGSSWSFDTIVSAARTFARPISDPNAEGFVFLQELVSYTNFNTATINTYPIFENDSLDSNDFVAPLDPPTGIKWAKIFEYFDSPDIDDWTVNLDLSAARDGDIIYAVYLYSVGTTSTAYIGSSEMDVVETMSGSQRLKVNSHVYDSGDTPTFRLVTALDASFQKALIFIAPSGTTVSDSGPGADVLEGELVAGIAYSSGNASAAHVWTPDTRVDRTLHGSSTVISFALGYSDSDATVAVSETSLHQSVVLDVPEVGGGGASRRGGFRGAQGYSGFTGF